MSYIRRVSEGPNFPDGAVHFQVGKDVIWNRQEGRKTHEISHIFEEKNEMGLTLFHIYIKNKPLNGELVSEVLWKTVPQGMYTVIEYAISSEEEIVI